MTWPIDIKFILDKPIVEVRNITQGTTHVSASISGIDLITLVGNNVELSSEQTVDNTKDTLTIINSEIDAMEEVQNKNKLKNIIHELYMESLSQWTYLS